MIESDALPSTSREIEDLTECPICLETFVQPVQLSCGHSFCNKCVEEITDLRRVICPQCRHMTEVPSEGFAINYRLQDLVALVSRAKDVGCFSRMQNFQKRSDEVNVSSTTQNGAQESDAVMMWLFPMVFNFEILCAASWGDDLLLGTDSGLMLCDCGNQSKVYELINRRRYEQMAVLEPQDVLITISGNNRSLRIYDLSWLMQKLLEAKTSVKGAGTLKEKGWTDLDDVQSVQHFKTVCYEQTKYLVVGMDFSIVIYIWEPDPYHKFVPFKSFESLSHSPLFVDLALENKARLKVLYASYEGFHAIDLDSSAKYDIYTLPKYLQQNILPRCIAVLPNSNDTQLLLCYNDKGVYVNIFGKKSRNVMHWVDMPRKGGSIAYISTGQIVCWGHIAIEVRSVDTGNLDIALMYGKVSRFKFLCEYNGMVIYTVAEPDGRSCRIQGIKGIQHAAKLQSKSVNRCIRLSQLPFRKYSVNSIAV
ncbi:unnamed protein product [Cylicocyclus nassatus]|uniref:non-specific serine/threonine protein kinase n=1 Tax=Cylicocyclus nassatus TaxID=53992 RepID=A0AA36MHZ1_CYLNA|nr:unnamed protein product [Cylicocyclus nassatus]